MTTPALLVAFLVAGSVQAAKVRMVILHADQPRAVIARVEDESVLIPLFACGPLLGSEVRWEKATNRWSIRSDKASARGFLDEPLVMVSGKPLLAKYPPRLLDGAPYMSLSVLNLLGRHAWETEFVWDEKAKELRVSSLTLAPVQAAERTRTISVPETPSGSRVIVLDAGHSRHGGVRGAAGLTEGELGLKLAQQVSVTLSQVSGLACVILQGDREELEPSEAASVVNALKAELFVSFHASAYGEPSLALWCWSAENLVKTAVRFRPFEHGGGAEGAAGGWATAAEKHLESSRSFAARVMRNLKGGGVPVQGPLLAPLLNLEGVSCPALVVDCQGIATGPGADLFRGEETVAAVAYGIARAVAAQMGLPLENP